MNISNISNRNTSTPNLATNTAKARRALPCIEAMPWSQELLAIFKAEFGLRRADLHGLGAQLIYHPLESRAYADYIQDNTPFHGQDAVDPLDLQYDSLYYLTSLPEVPFGRSIRVPIYGLDGTLLDHHYYRLKPKFTKLGQSTTPGQSATSGHVLQRYMHPDSRPQVGVLPEAEQRLRNSSAIVFLADNPFLALLLNKAAEKDGECPSVISANGLLRHGVSNGEFRLHPAKSGDSKARFTARDAKAFVELLGLHQTPFAEKRHITVFLESHWLHQGSLDDSMALLQGMLSLREFVKEHGGSIAFATPPVLQFNGLSFAAPCSGNGPSSFAHDIARNDIAHLVARYGLIYSEDSYLRDDPWPGFDLAV